MARRASRQVLHAGFVVQDHAGIARSELAQATQIGEVKVTPMHAFADVDADYHRWLAVSFRFRPALKAVGFASSGTIVAVLLLYGLAGLGAVLRSAAEKGERT